MTARTARPAAAALLAAAVLSLVSAGLHAQTTVPAARPEPSVSNDRSVSKAWERAHRASKIIGTDVRNRQGQRIGDVKDVVLDPNGTIAYAVVSTGGFLGVGDRLHAIPWTALQKDDDRGYFVLDIDKQRLGQAPGFDSKHWPDMAEERWNSQNRSFYATPPGGPAAPR
jgi:sporulation protein YlmC with PRC-barrel domain